MNTILKAQTRRRMMLGSGILCLASVMPAASFAGPREDVVRALVRLKSSIETGVSFLRFTQLIQELDEVAQLAEATKSTELSALEIGAVKSIVRYLTRIAKAWNFVSGPTHCRDSFGDFKLGAYCAGYLKLYLDDVGTTLEKLEIKGDYVHPREIVGALLREANKKIVELLGALTATR